jgi:PAS fold
MFDEQQRLSICNERYLQVYGMSPEVVKPGVTVQAVLAHRYASGSMIRDPEEYRDQLLPEMLAPTEERGRARVLIADS